MTSEARLKIIIVGAGVAGLSAGLMLREFADVTILETASELKEVGAAVTLGPGAVKILRRFGVHLDQEGGVVATHTSVWTFKGKQVAHVATNAIERAGEVNVSVHRADLHSALLRSATSADGPGTPCKILLDHAVVKLDVEAGSVTVKNGTEYTADAIIGADGVRSNVRPFVVDGDTTAKPTGESGYRYLLQPEDLKAINHPIMQGATDTIPPTMHVVIGPQKKLVAYPCRGGKVFNCLAFVPDSELHETSSEKWQRKGDVSALLESYKDFDPMWTDILRLAKDLGLWQMRDLDPLPNWVKGSAIIIGDAAHPMLPHQAAGAMSAIEDAEALSVYLRKASPNPASVREALDHAFRLRHKRASLCQTRSRAAGLVASDNIGKQSPDDLFALWMYPGAEQYEIEHPEMVIPK